MNDDSASTRTHTLLGMSKVFLSYDTPHRFENIETPFTTLIYGLSIISTKTFSRHLPISVRTFRGSSAFLL